MKTDITQQVIDHPVINELYEHFKSSIISHFSEVQLLAEELGQTLPASDSKYYERVSKHLISTEAHEMFCEILEQKLAELSEDELQNYLYYLDYKNSDLKPRVDEVLNKAFESFSEDAITQNRLPKINLDNYNEN